MLDEDKYLIERHTLVLAPSLRALHCLRALRNSEKPRSAVIVGISDFSKTSQVDGETLKPLPAVKQEVFDAKGVCENTEHFTTVLAEDEATPGNVYEAANGGSHRFLHFATHGLLEKKALVLGGNEAFLAAEMLHDWQLSRPHLLVTLLEVMWERMAFKASVMPSWLLVYRAPWQHFGRSAMTRHRSSCGFCTAVG